MHLASTRNALAFLAMDRSRWRNLDEALRRYLAWDSIVDEREQLCWAPNQVKQAGRPSDTTADGVLDAAHA